ncbi:MAG: hypothetical protein V1887_03140 [Candidatus Aenigmatarchaeota archaeon]
MPVVGLTVKNMAAKRIGEYQGPAGVNNNARIIDVTETDLTALGKKGLSVSFEFKSDYVTEKKVPFAEITISGDVLIMADNSVELLKNWKKDKKLPEDLNLQAVNSVLRKCMIKALTLSEDLNLPPPIPLPFAQKKEEHPQDSRYIG